LGDARHAWREPKSTARDERLRRGPTERVQRADGYRTAPTLA
jgi:hypothetical protein